MAFQGLGHGRGFPTWIEIGPAKNVTWEFDGGVFNYTTYLFDTLKWCENWRDPQHIMFQLANACFLVSYVAPSNRVGLVLMHSVLVLGFMLFSGWAWNVVCAPDVFSWNLAFMFLNLLQLFYVIYLMRPVKFDPELEDAYHTLFKPFKVSRLVFKKLVSAEFAQIASLQAGEAYAMQNLTRTDRLGLLLTGKVNVISDHQFLHPILPCEFLDSPEFESSRANVDEKFKVSIVAATSCRYLYWQRSSLEYLFAKETYLATVVTTLIAKDIATKLYAMNNKIVTDRGSHLDIRLPSISISFTDKKKSPLRKYKMTAERKKIPDDNANSCRERLRKETYKLTANGRLPELQPLRELPSTDDIETWLDTSTNIEKPIKASNIKGMESGRNENIKLQKKAQKMEENISDAISNGTGYETQIWNETEVVPMLLENNVWSNESSWNSTTRVTHFCDVWEEAQHNLFQTANMFLAAAFIVPKNFKQNILLVRALLSIGFLLCAIWGGFSVCGPDILGWNIILCLVNIGHTISLTARFLPPRLNVELTDLYLKQFKPLKVGKKHFKELTREAQILKLEMGDTYAVEDITPADEKLSILLRGKLKVSCDDAHLHYILPYQFIDSPEWEAFHEWSADIFQVTIEAEEECIYLCWPRLRLERVLRHRTLLRQVFESMIGKDITHKLYALNEHLGGLKQSKTDKFNEACKKNLNRSLSLDAVHTGRNGNVRSQVWRATENMKGGIYPCSSPSPVKSRHAHMYMPIVASQFPVNYPFLEQRLASQNSGTLPLSAADKNRTPLITESGRLHIPPAPAAPVALVPVMVPVLGPPLDSIPIQPLTPIKRLKSTKTSPSIKKIFSKEKEVKFETPV